MIVGLRKDLAGVFRMQPKFPAIATNMGDVLRDLMGENGWAGAEDWALGIGALSDTIRGYQGTAKRGEARCARQNGVSYAPPAKAAPTERDASKERFLPGLTNRMCARLQGFPDDWQFVGGLGPVANQIGNAVAPPFGTRAAEAYQSPCD
jgi:DNA (cytosine-5)-methyltransferase 1